MKNPNGTGGIVKLSGKRRKPYAVRVTVGIVCDHKNQRRKQKQRYIGYYATKVEAQAALADYNKGFFNLDLSGATFADIHKRFALLKYDSLSKSSVDGYNSNFATAKSIHEKRFSDLKASHLQAVVNLGKSYSARSKIKSYFNQLYEMAIQDDIVQKNYAALLHTGKDDSEGIHNSISDITLIKLWQSGDPNAELIILLAMTGLRGGELIEIKTEDVNINQRYMIGGGKTAAGKNRIIPLHRSIIPIIKKKLDGEYLIEEGGKHFSRHKLAARIKKVSESEILSHDGRVTFASNMYRAGADRLAVKRILGHSSQDVTDSVYTKIEIENLIREVDKLDSLPIFPPEICRLLVAYHLHTEPDESSCPQFKTISK